MPLLTKGLRVAAREGRRTARMWVPPLTAGVLPRGLDHDGKLFMAVSSYAARRYRPQPYGGPTVVVESKVRLEKRPFELAAVRALLRGEVTELVVPGFHGEILRPPHVHTLAAQLDELLPRA